MTKTCIFVASKIITDFIDSKPCSNALMSTGQVVGFVTVYLLSTVCTSEKHRYMTSLIRK